MVLLITQLYASSRHSISRGRERLTLRSDKLMLDNTLTPLYQERVASLSFNTDEHTNEQFDEDDDDEDDDFFEEWLMTGTGRRA